MVALSGTIDVRRREAGLSWKSSLWFPNGSLVLLLLRVLLHPRLYFQQAAVEEFKFAGIGDLSRVFRLVRFCST